VLTFLGLAQSDFVLGFVTFGLANITDMCSDAPECESILVTFALDL